MLYNLFDKNQVLDISFKSLATRKNTLAEYFQLRDSVQVRDRVALMEKPALHVFYIPKYLSWKKGWIYYNQIGTDLFYVEKLAFNILDFWQTYPIFSHRLENILPLLKFLLSSRAKASQCFVVLGWFLLSCGLIHNTPKNCIVALI